MKLYLEGGNRDEAVRVLLRAAETARTLEARAALLVRAHGLVKDPALRDEARRGIALCTLAEFEETPARTEAERRRLGEAARELEQLGSFREAARAFDLLDDREAVVRVLTVAGDVEGMERLVGDRDAEERKALRRRAALESFESSWASGDRVRALEGLRQWLADEPTDHEARASLDARAADLLREGVLDLSLEGRRITAVGRLPVVLGREGEVCLRGASVSRRHARLGWEDDRFVVEDVGSRAGTLVDGVAIAAAIPVGEGTKVSLGGDLHLRARREEGALVLEVEQGLDRGRVVVAVHRAWSTPLGRVHFSEDGPVLTPAGPVSLNGQRVAVPVLLVRGDRIERGATVMRVLGRGE